MMRNRVALVLVLVLLVAFYIFYTEYFSYFLLVYALCALSISAALFVPGAFLAKASLVSGMAAMRLGGELELCLALGRVIPFAFIGARVRCTNLMSGETGVERKRAAVSYKNKGIALAYRPAHCGLIRCEVELFRVYDLFAVLSLRKRGGQTVEILCMPKDMAFEHEIDLSAPGDTVERSADADPYGSYDLREYRPGDPIKSVHWKASAKTGELYVKELNNNTPKSVVLGVDILGTPYDADLIIAHAAAFSRDMLKRRIPFELLYIDNAARLRTHMVETRDDYFRGMRLIMACPIRKSGDPLKALAGDMSGKRMFMASNEGLLDVNNDMLIKGEEA